MAAAYGVTIWQLAARNGGASRGMAIMDQASAWDANENEISRKKIMKKARNNQHRRENENQMKSGVCNMAILPIFSEENENNQREERNMEEI